MKLTVDMKLALLEAKIATVEDNIKVIAANLNKRIVNLEQVKHERSKNSGYY